MHPGPPEFPAADLLAPGVACATGETTPGRRPRVDDGASARPGGTLTCTAANPTTNRMEIRILFLGELGARFGREHVLESTEVLTVQEVRRRLGDQVEGSAAVLTRPDVRLAVDQTVVPDTALVRPGQEVAVLPIYSGG